MKILYRAHLLNIDTALGAVISSNFVALTVSVALPWVVNLALFTSVLIIYNFDHLADAHKISGRALTDRHQFYKDNHFNLKIFQVALMIFGAGLIYFMPQHIVKAGSFIVLMVTLYFAILEVMPAKLVFFKEIMVALVYATSIFLAPLATTDISLSLDVVLLFVQFFSLALMNLYIFSWFDKDIDSDEGHPSIMNSMGEKTVLRIVIMFFAVIIFSGLIYLMSDYVWQVQIVILCMGLILLTLSLQPKWLIKRNLFRTVGDLVFAVPIFYNLFV